jgi:hypothetical protein
MDVPCRFMEVRDEAEGEEICKRLRTAGIKCAVEPLPDANSMSAIWGGQAPPVLFVLVNEQDVAQARTALASR